MLNTHNNTTNSTTGTALHFSATSISAWAHEIFICRTEKI